MSAKDKPPGTQATDLRLSEHLANLGGLGSAVMVIGLALNHAPGCESYPVGSALEALGSMIQDERERAEAAHSETLAALRDATRKAG